MRTAGLRWLGVMSALGAARCGSERGGAPDAAECTATTALADPMRWTLVDASLDPFAARFDAGVASCPESDGASATDAGFDGSPDGPGCTGPRRCAAEDVHFAWFGQEPSLQVDTRRCNWATIEQPALASVEAGEARAVRLWYTAQTPSEPAVAVAVVAFGGDIVWQEQLELPVSRGSLLYDLTTWPASIAKGETLTFHLHNHGDNSWNLLELSVIRPAACQD